MSPINIAIVGAGPAGCTLALILHNAGINATIFEGDATINARNQGGSLDLHESTGLLALRRADLYDTFTKNCRYDGESMIFANKYMRRYINLSGATSSTSRGRPEIDRATLRQILVDALPPTTIQWSHRVRRVDSTDPSNITLHFDHHPPASGFDLLVGADGTWSKIRPLLTHIKPFYAGMSMIRFSIPSAETRHPDLHRLVNRGALFAFSDQKAITVLQLGDGSLSVGVVRLTPEELIKDLPHEATDGKVWKEYTLVDFEDWDPRLREMIEVADESDLWFGNIYSLPPGARWAHRPGVTLIGDAAHVLVPWAGEGVNLSMEDSYKLADAIIGAVRGAGEKGVDREELSRRVRAFEEDMFVRAKTTSEMSLEMMNCLFAEAGAPDLTVEKYVIAAMRDQAPWWGMPLVKLVVTGYYKWFRWWYPGLGDIHTKTK
ncbi:Ubiquinone biosynthesis monooxygenase COQ6, mitochondrial [Sphaceloma murrayae]|uniref:Ubiquinone biosynthesis monooxygenase COQ6, mitochondrial n=1 Tax=Sphaceloma murrayae TaxID=2082308 RepID=A0A2K1R3C7_9PEZI|nr:Ubiquinone biosynthesis monooxygenase COQ6, mitochondrial [Sphaceloma murrayae]